MKSITITAAMNRLITCLIWDYPFEIKPNSQISESLTSTTVNPHPPTNPNAYAYLTPDFDPEQETRDLKVGMLMIGRGGHRYVTNSDGDIDPTTYPHKATDTGLYEPLPFIVRPVDSDLQDEDRLRYRLRTISEIGGRPYAFYFGRIFDKVDDEIVEVIETVQDGKVVETLTYEATVNDLYPVREDLSVESDGIFMRTYSTEDVKFTEEEVEELKYACLLMYGSENKAVISEIAFCFGIDKTVTRMYDATGNELVNAPAFTKEYVACHMGVVESTFKPIIYTGEINDTKNIGISEPLYGGR